MDCRLCFYLVLSFLVYICSLLLSLPPSLLLLLLLFGCAMLLAHPVPSFMFPQKLVPLSFILSGIRRSRKLETLLSWDLRRRWGLPDLLSLSWLTGEENVHLSRLGDSDRG